MRQMVDARIRKDLDGYEVYSPLLHLIAKMTKSHSTKVAVIQTSCNANPSENLHQAIEQIRQVAAEGAQIVCLQELFSTLYLCQTEDHSRFELAEPIPGPTTESLCRLAEQLSIVVVAGLFEKRAAGVYHNTAVAIDADGQLLGIYRKMHIPDDPHYYEKFYFTPGDLGFKTFSTRFGKVGICICWDQWFPEAARLTAMQGAELIVYPTAIGWLAEDKEPYGESQLSAWQTMMRSHAIANGVFIAAPNRVGTEQSIEFWGSSFVADPYGNLLDVASNCESQNLLVDCSFELVETARTHWPFLRDRRIDAYNGLTRRWLDQ